MATLRLLVVDDEPGIRSGIQRILRDYSVGYPFLEEDFDFEIIEAETGEKAIEIIDGSKPDIILLDNKLPGIHGIEVLEYINKMDHDAEVMMITSFASLELAVKATNFGAFNFVPKPFTPQELKSAIDSIAKHLFLKRMTRKMKKEDEQLRFQFLSVLSHELKSPINAIEGYLYILQDKKAGKLLDDYLPMVNRSLDRLKGMRMLISDLLDLTRIESGGKNRNIEIIDITEIYRMAKDTIAPLADQNKIKIRPTGDEPIYVYADRSELEIIFNNLLSNAVKYNKEGGKVEVIFKKTDHSVHISVKDTGIGMSENEVNRLFQEFVRIKNMKTRNISGSGLGLSITKKLVELYDGNIQVESHPDKGSTFSVSLPILINKNEMS